MFKVTKFNGEELYVNPDTIQFVVGGGDTVIHFASGDKLLVKESTFELQTKFINYKKLISASCDLIVEDEENIQKILNN